MVTRSAFQTGRVCGRAISPAEFVTRYHVELDGDAQQAALAEVRDLRTARLAGTEAE
jgi:hypothetical protein